MSIPDRLGMQVGYRRWVVEFTTLKEPAFSLHPMSYLSDNLAWRSTANVANCDRYSHKNAIEYEAPPLWDCTCGYHAFYDYRIVKSLKGRANALDIIGISISWGTIIHHDSFFRAQYAAPIALYIPSSRYSEFILMKPYIPDYILQIENEDDLLSYGEEVKTWNALPSHLRADPTKPQSDGK